MISDEEARERIKAYADATGSTMAEFGEGMGRLTGFLASTARSVSELAVLTADKPGASEDASLTQLNFHPQRPSSP